MITLQRNDGYLLNLEDLTCITKITGLNFLNNEISTVKKAFGNGDIRVGSRIPSRIINIDCECLIPEVKKKIRRILREFFRQDNTFRLNINDIEIPLFIDCELDLLDIEHIEENEGVIYIKISLFCADPLFKSQNEFGRDIASISEQGGFTMYFGDWNTLGVYNFAQEVFLGNDGDGAVYPTCTIYAEDEVVNFKLKKNGSEYINIIPNLKKGDEVYLDFTQGKMFINGVDRSNEITRDSIFFTIDVNGNNISYVADIGENVVKVFIFYNQVYNGVDEL